LTQPPALSGDGSTVAISAYDGKIELHGLAQDNTNPETDVLDVESCCQADFASRMIVTAAWGSGTVIVTLRPLCIASRRAAPFRTVK